MSLFNVGGYLSFQPLKRDAFTRLDFALTLTNLCDEIGVAEYFNGCVGALCQLHEVFHGFSVTSLGEKSSTQHGSQEGHADEEGVLGLAVVCQSRVAHEDVEVAASLHWVEDDATGLELRHELLVDAQVEGPARLQELGMGDRARAVQIDGVGLGEGVHRASLKGDAPRLAIGYHIGVGLAAEGDLGDGNVLVHRQPTEQSADVPVIDPADDGDARSVDSRRSLV